MELNAMNDLDTLRPEVQKALDDLSYFLTGTHNHDDFYAIRAELLQRALLEKQLRDAYAKQHEALQGWVQRATDAEAELAAALKANRDCVDHFEQMQAELAALKARMRPVARVENGEVHVYMDTAHEGKEVAVVVVGD